MSNPVEMQDDSGSPSETLASLFDHADSVRVDVPLGKNEDLGHYEKRISYIFSREQRMRSYEELPGYGDSDANYYREVSLFAESGDSHELVYSRKNESEYIAHLLLHPPSSRETIFARQQLFGELAESDILDQLILYKNTSYSLIGGIDWLVHRPYEENSDDYRSILDFYNQGFADETVNAGDEETIGEIVSNAIDQIVEGLNGLNQIHQLISQSNLEFLAQSMAQLPEDIVSWNTRLSELISFEKKERPELIDFDVNDLLYKSTHDLTVGVL